MYDRRLTLQLLFDEMIALSHSTFMMREAIEGGGYPLSGLMKSLTNPFERSLINTIVTDYTSEKHEFQLNDAGLKLYWRLDRKYEVLKLSISGDQTSDYPHFVSAVRQIIKQAKLR